ncbi:MAG TPA: carcinine hydrolase/isopenicillin-N N-acyltransferase family protein, partial [Rectinemataceae bacterium]
LCKERVGARVQLSSGGMPVCDTLYRAPFFGKNSDRHPAEPQSLCLVPRRDKSANMSRPGGELPIQDSGLSYLLSKPSWIWGGEMGINEAGVAIGNEAVFSRFKPDKGGVLGMDILRAALGAASTAKDAVDVICCFTEKHAQGGNGAFKGSMYYDNSYLVSDPRGAYIVETAGKRWAWRAADSKDAISNCYCIEEDYKRLDAQTRKEIAPVNERAACSDEADPGRKGEKESFKAHVENRFYLRFSKGEARRDLSLSLLGKAVDIQAFLGVLRSHGPFDPSKPWPRHMESLCIHSGGFPASATTASMAVEYRGESAIVWFTGTSYPCLSLYKPVILNRGVFRPLWPAYDYAEGSASSLEYWNAQRAWISSSRAAAKSKDPAFAAARDQAQESLAMIAASALSDMEASGDEAALAVLGQEVQAIVAGWEKDCGL